MAAPSRRELLLIAATELFAAQGYHAVGIDNIGSAAGISGPGVYRHFTSKQALLEALCDRAMTRMLANAQHIPAEHADPAEALSALLDLHVRFAVDERALLGVWLREQRALSDDVRRSLRRRQRAYEEPWRDVLSRLRDELTPAEVAVAVSSVLAMLNSAALTTTDLSPEALAALLRRMAVAALLVPAAG